MADYLNNINTLLYTYRRPIYITEPTGERQTFIPLKLNLHSGNFNFDTARSDGADFRVAESDNGTGVLQMWTAYWDGTQRKATVWFKLPELLAGDTKTLFVFWGYENDPGDSDLRYMLGESTDGETVYTDNLALYASTSGSSPGTVDPNNAFDGTTATCDIIKDGWVQCNYFVPTKINKLTATGDSYGWAGYGFELRASNDDFVSEDVLITDVTDYLGAETHEYFFGNDTGYLNYRVVNDKGQAYWRIQEIEMMAINDAESASTPVFYFGDDFEGTELDVNKWPTNNGSWTISDSKINLAATAWIETAEDIIVSSPGKFMLEDGIVGIGSPTSETLAAHRYRFFGGENVLGIDYYWEGSVNRKHDAVEAGTYETYNEVNTGLIEGDYTQTNIGYHESTDKVYQGMFNRGGDSAPIYSEDLCEGGTAYDSHYSVADRAFDNDEDTYYFGATTDCWVGYEFATSEIIARVTLLVAANLFGVEVQGTNDPDGDWDTLATESWPAESKATITIEFENSTSYSHIRLYITPATSSNQPYIYEIEMMSILAYASGLDYAESWERQVHRNTEISYFRMWGEASSTANGVEVDWVIARDFNPESDPPINYGELYVEYELVNHQTIDQNEYQDDVTSVDFYHASTMGGDPYRMSDNVTNSISNVFISDTEVTEGDLVIDFGRTSVAATSNSYYHFSSDNTVEFYNASKLADLDEDEYGRDYWQTTTTSGWACIEFPTTENISCLAFTAVSGSSDRMPNNFRLYGSQYNPRFSGWDYKVLIYEGVGRDVEEEQVFYFNTGQTFYKYYILEVLDTHGGNVAIQEWAMYARTSNIDKKTISKLRLHPVAFEDNEYFFVKEVELYGSNNGYDWDLLLDRTATATPFVDYVDGRWSEYTFENVTNYYLYKLTCYDNWRAETDQIKIAEWEMLERVEELDSFNILAGTTNEINNIWADPTADINTGSIYISNDVFNTVANNKLAEYTTLSGGVDDFNVKL